METEDEDRSDDYCEYCGIELGGESHYHCPRCKEECSMMGHWNYGNWLCNPAKVDPTYDEVISDE